MSTTGVAAQVTARPARHSLLRVIRVLVGGGPLLGPVCFWAPYPPPVGEQEPRHERPRLVDAQVGEGPH